MREQATVNKVARRTAVAYAPVLAFIITPSALMLRENLAAWRQRRRATSGGAAPSPAE
jgi:hypothetical protein